MVIFPNLFFHKCSKLTCNSPICIRIKSSWLAPPSFSKYLMASTRDVQNRPSGLRNLTDSTILPKLFIVIIADFQPSGTVGSWSFQS